MENTVSTNVVKLDLQTILANYRKPEFWQKTWTIIDTSELKVVWYISYIDCVNGKINSCLRAFKKNIKRGNKSLGNYWYTDESVSLPSIPINNNEYTQRHFDNALYGSTIELLKDVERHMIYEYAEYKEAENVQKQYKEELRQIANDFLNENKVTNLAIRDAYIDKYIDDNYDEKVKYYTGQVVNNYQFKVITNAYIYTAAWFDHMEDYEKYNEYLGETRKSIRWDLWNKVKEIQTDEWQNSMKEQLSDI